MSPLRKVLLIAAVPIGLAAILFVLACLPAVQTWAARRVLAGQPDTRAELGRIAVGLGGATVTDLVIEQPGLKLTLPSAEIDLPLIAAVRGRVDIGRLVARGWTVELSRTPPAADTPPTPAKSVSTDPRQLFDALRLPVALSLDGLDVAGRVVQPAGEAAITLSGGGLRAGGQGRFELVAGYVPASELGLPADKIDLTATLTARLRDEHTLDRLAVDLTAKTDRATLRAKIDSERTAAGVDTHAISVTVDDHPLVAVDLELAAASGQATGTWKLDVRDRDIAPFLPGQALPAFSALGEGRFASDPQGTRPEVGGSVRIELDQLQRLSPELATIGAVRLDTVFELALAGEQVLVRALKVNVAGADPVLTVEALQPFSVNPSTMAMKAKEPGVDALRVELTGLPLAWAQPWLGDMRLTGGPARGEWRVTLEPDTLRARPVTALTVPAINLDRAGAPLLRAVDLSVAMGVTRQGDNLAAELLDLSARSGGRALFTLKGRGTPASVKASLEADLPALLAQPAAGGHSGVVAGRIQADLDAVLADGWKAGANLTVTGLRAAEPVVFPEIALRLNASGTPAGALEAEMPVTFTTAGRRSDLLVKASLVPQGDITRIVGSVGGDVVYVQDIQTLGALVPAESSAPATPAESKPTEESPAPAPFWSGYEGGLTVRIKRVVYTPAMEVKDVEGEITINRDSISLGKLTAKVGSGGELTVTGRLEHEADKTKPYALAGDLGLTGFDPGPFLKSDNSRRPPVLEGDFDVKGSLSGRAADPALLAGSATGRIDVTGRQGTLRALGVKVETAANLAAPASAILGLLGASTGNEDVMKYAERARAGVEVAKQLSAVAFDRLDMTLQREKNNDLAIRDMVLQAPMVRLAGEGRVKYQPGVPLLRQPLNVQLNLSAKDRLASGLSSLKLIGAEADASGYFPLTESIRLDGSLAEVGTSQLERLIRRALTQ